MSVQRDFDDVQSIGSQSVADTVAPHSINLNSSSTLPECSSVAVTTVCIITPLDTSACDFTAEPSFNAPIQNISTYQSPTASIGPICRICHEGDVKEDLVSPCRCTGTVGLVHQTCLEKWLSSRSDTSDNCEICDYIFTTARYPKSMSEWIRSDEILSRSLIRDFTCFLILTPLAIVSCLLYVTGAMKRVLWNNSLETECLMALLASSIFTVYFVWNILTLRHHMKCYFKWRSQNQNVKLLHIQRPCASTEYNSSDSNVVQVVSNVLENLGSPNISIEIEHVEN